MSRGLGLAVLLVGAAVVLVSAPLIGPMSLPIAAIADPFGSDPASRILWQIRVPRVVAAFLGGAGLAVGGAVFLQRPELVKEVGGDGTAPNAIAAPALMERLMAQACAAGGLS